MLSLQNKLIVARQNKLIAAQRNKLVVARRNRLKDVHHALNDLKSEGMDGNGRMGRFLMNAMLISGGYNWTIVPVERRQEYMKAIEKGSVDGNITDFTLFISSLLK